MKVFSASIGMEFGRDKCAKASFNRGKIIKTKNIIIENINIIRVGTERNVKVSWG